MWMVNQFSEDLNDVFEWHCPPMSSVKKCLYKRLTDLIFLGLSSRIRLFGAVNVATERIVEYPTIFSWLPEKKGRVLDIGCASSRLPIQLASLGYEVHGLDARPYRYIHHNFTFHQQDIFLWNPDLVFDTVFLISTLEHLGSGGYGDKVLDNADHLVIQKIIKIIKLNGQLIVSVPFGKRGQTPKHRIYDMAQLEVLFGDFTWRRSAYFKRVGYNWLPAFPEDLSEIVSPPGIVNGVAILDLVLKT